MHGLPAAATQSLVGHHQVVNANRLIARGAEEYRRRCLQKGISGGESPNEDSLEPQRTQGRSRRIYQRPSLHQRGRKRAAQMDLAPYSRAQFAVELLSYYEHCSFTSRLPPFGTVSALSVTFRTWSFSIRPVAVRLFPKNNSVDDAWTFEIDTSPADDNVEVEDAAAQVHAKRWWFADATSALCSFGHLVGGKRGGVLF